VYRSTLADVSTAVPLGPAWQSESNFLDITAAVPVRAGSGCAPSRSVVTEYFYWVKARASGCESGFQSVGTLGFRVDAKALHLAGGVGGALALLCLATLLSRRRQGT
jgi:hypothetical protein